MGRPSRGEGRVPGLLGGGVEGVDGEEGGNVEGLARARLRFRKDIGCWGGWGVVCMLEVCCRRSAKIFGSRIKLVLEGFTP